jgi:oligopeptide/dipeptide ABC transporter ATP-binding protein
VTTIEQAASGSGTESAPLMTLQHVSQLFDVKGGQIKAVDNISLAINPGEVLCLVGESGSGKTTAARMAAGLRKPSRGTVNFAGKDIGSMSRAEYSLFRRSVQYIHQDPYSSLNPTRSVQRMLMSPMLKHGVAKNRTDATRMAAELLERVDLTPPNTFMQKFPHQMSGGQRQRAAVARALTLSPKIIIADESTSMLDVSIRISMLAMLGRLRDDLGVGFLFITHDLAIAKYFGWDGKTAVMYLGRIVEFGPTPEIINKPQHPYTKALIEAIPEPDPDLTLAKGSSSLRSMEIPSLHALPSGCTFHPRCHRFEEGLCDVEVPELTPITERQSASCHVVVREAGIAPLAKG